MTALNAVEFVEYCEQRLGLALDTRLPLWKARSHEAGKLKKAIAKDPALYTWANLELAVELLHRTRTEIRSAVFVLYHVEQALTLAAEAAKPRPVGELIDAALAAEMSTQPSLQQQSWIGQLTRAVGTYREQTYQEWVSERGHLLAASS